MVLERQQACKKKSGIERETPGAVKSGARSLVLKI